PRLYCSLGFVGFQALTMNVSPKTAISTSATRVREVCGTLSRYIWLYSHASFSSMTSKVFLRTFGFSFCQFHGLIHIPFVPIQKQEHCRCSPVHHAPFIRIEHTKHSGRPLSTLLTLLVLIRSKPIKSHD